MLNCFQASFAKENDVGKESQLWLYTMDQIAVATTKWEIFKAPKDKIFRFFYDVSINKITEYVILSLTFLNLVILALDVEGATSTYDYVGNVINNTTTSFFILEAIIKLIGLGHVGYFESAWNRFDFFIVVSAIIDILFVIANIGNTDQSLVKFLKTFQILRILRMIRVTR